MNVYILAKASMFDKIYAVINIPGSTTCVPFSISSGSSSTSSWLDDISAQNIIRNKYLQSVPEDENSFRCVDDWLKQLEEHGNIPKMIKIIIGNKNDVDKEERKVEMR